MSRFLKLKDLASSTLLSSLVLCDDLEQRDILSKLPTCVLEEVMKNIDELNLDADVFKLLYLSFNICELITQRKFTARDISLLQLCNSKVIRHCGHLSNQELAQKLSCLSYFHLKGLRSAFRRTCWCAIITQLMRK